MVSGIGKRTGHSTLKKCKGKSLSPHNTPPKKQYRTTRQVWHYNTALVRTHLCDYEYKFMKRLSYFPEEASNTASLNAKDSILMNCRRGTWMSVFGWAIQLKSARVTNTQPPPNPTEQLDASTNLQWRLKKRETGLPHSLGENRASCYIGRLLLQLLSCEAKCPLDSCWMHLGVA